MERKCSLLLKYNDKDVTRAMMDHVTSFSYTDAASGESDSISIEIGDKTHKWSDGWMPDEKDSIYAQVTTTNWHRDRDRSRLVFGTFQIDDLSVSGNPRSLSIGAISGPVQDGFRETERTKTWQHTNLFAIAKKIGERYGLTVYYDAAAVLVKKCEQSGESDSAFLASMCEKYGLSMKAYRKKMIIFDREKYKKKPAAHTVSLDDVSEWSYTASLTRRYTGGLFTFSGTSKKKITVKIGSGNNIYRMTDSADSAADAKRKLQAAVNRENHGKVKISLTMMGDASYASGQCVRITGAGSKISGKYYIDSVTHQIDGSGGYTMTLDLSKVFEAI